MTTNFPDLVTMFGGVPAGMYLPFSRYAKYYFVEPAFGSDSNDGLSLESSLASLDEAEDRLVADHNDTVILVSTSNTASATTTYLSSGLTWDKDGTHVIGICAPTGIGQRARVAQLSTATSVSPLIDIQADNCSFQNLSFFQGVNNAASLIDVRVSGSHNFFNNVNMAGGGHTANAVDGCASLNLYQAASENRFVGCTIGVDTVAAATGVVALLFSGGTADIHTTRNEFRDCKFRLKAGHAGAAFIELSTIYDIDRDTTFENCWFINLASTAMTTAIVCPAGFDKNDKRLLFDERCKMIGAPAWDASDRDIAYGAMGTPTGIDLSGVMLALEG